MNSVVKILALALFATMVAFTPARAADAAKSNISIAVVDIQSLLKDSKAAQNIESQLVTIRKNFQSEVEVEEKALRAKEKEIMDKKSSMKEDELKAKVAEFQKQVSESEKKIRGKKAKLEKGIGAANEKLRGEIFKVVSEIGEKQDLDLVLTRTAVVIASKTLDITAQVLERINADLPTVAVSVQ